VARCRASGPGSAGIVAAAGAIAAQRVDSRLSHSCPGRTRDRHHRPARPGPRDAARAGGPRGETVADPAVRGARARGGLAAARRSAGNEGHARRPAGSMLAAADRSALATSARPAPGRHALPDAAAGRLRARTRPQRAGPPRTLDRRCSGHRRAQHRAAPACGRGAAPPAQRVRMARSGGRHRPASQADADLPGQGNRRAVAARPHQSLPGARPAARPDPGRPAGITRRTSLHPHPGPAARPRTQHRV
jgi:hypothetical protein